MIAGKDSDRTMLSPTMHEGDRPIVNSDIIKACNSAGEAVGEYASEDE